MNTRIKWQYTHQLGRGSTEIVKEGEYIGKVRHTYRHWDKHMAEQMAVVKFDGNKSSSRVPFDELVFQNDIIINGRNISFYGLMISHNQIISLSHNTSAADDSDRAARVFTLTYRGAKDDLRKGMLEKDESIRVSTGMIFNCFETNNA